MVSIGSAGSTQGPKLIYSCAQLIIVPGLALPNTEPTAAHGWSCARIRASAQPGSGYECSSAYATMGALAWRKPSAKAFPVDVIGPTSATRNWQKSCNSDSSRLRLSANG